MYYSREVLDEIIERNDIVDVISSYIQLKKSGANYVGLCPFHNEKTPSFSISQTKQIFHCFGCGEGGNVISFFMKYNNSSFNEAVESLANRAGIKIEYRERNNKKDRLRSKLIELNKWVTKFYMHNLLLEYSNNNSKVKKYLLKRELSKDIINKFAIGYSMNSYYSLYKFLKSKGYDDEVLAKSGLFKYNKNGAYDIFRNRLMFPIVDTSNKIVGFGGRVLDDALPKYLNSPETILFDKSKSLYGLNYAKLSKRGYLILCEGYMDVISMFKYGFDCAVAALGTAFTSMHGIILKRYTGNVYLSFDSDKAGINATKKTIPILVNAGITVHIINLHPYKDPDEFLKNLGKEEFEKRIGSAKSYFSWEMELLKNKFNLNDPAEKTSFQRALASELNRFDEKLERENYIHAMSKEYSIDFDDLSKLADDIRDKKEIKNNQNNIIEKNKKPSIYNTIIDLQNLMISYCCEDEKYFNLIKKYVKSIELFDEQYKLIYEKICSYNTFSDISIAHILNDDGDEKFKKVALNIIAINYNSSKGNDVIQVLNTIKNLIIRFKKTRLEYLMNNENDLKIISDYMQKKRDITNIASLIEADIYKYMEDEYND